MLKNANLRSLSDEDHLTYEGSWKRNAKKALGSLRHRSHGTSHTLTLPITKVVLHALLFDEVMRAGSTVSVAVFSRTRAGVAGRSDLICVEPRARCQGVAIGKYW